MRRSAAYVTRRKSTYGNYVLTQKGYENIELESVEKKTACKPQGLEVMMSEFSKAGLVELI